MYIRPPIYAHAASAPLLYIHIRSFGTRLNPTPFGVLSCCRPAVVPAVVSAGVVLESAAVAPRGGQAAASLSLVCRRPRAQQVVPSNESKRGVNPTHTEPQPDTAGGKHHRGETAHGETHPPTCP